MLDSFDIQTLLAVCRAGLSGSAVDRRDMFSLLEFLEPEDKRQFWRHLTIKHPLVVEQLKLAKVGLSEPIESTAIAPHR